MGIRWKFDGFEARIVARMGNLNDVPTLEVGAKGRFVRSEGACAAITADWLRRCATAGPVTRREELRSGLAVQLLQTAYQLDRLGTQGTDNEQVYHAVGFSRALDQPISNRSSVAKAVNDWDEFEGGLPCNGAAIHLYGKRESHAVGVYMFPHAAHFFDPNGGIIELPRGGKIGDYVVAYARHNYPDLHGKPRMIVAQL